MRLLLLLLMFLCQFAGAQSGFTTFAPSSDTRTIYVSDSEGADTYDCLSNTTPCKTLVAGLKKMRPGFPDHLLLKTGDVWRDQVFYKLDDYAKGRSLKEPAVIAFYGDPKAGRPRISSGKNIVHIYNTRNLAFIGLDFYNYPKVWGDPGFTGQGKGDFIFLGPITDVLIEDCVFNHIELIVQRWETGSPANFTLRRNIWTGAYFNETSYNRNTRPSNVYAEGVLGLTIEENVFDYGGWHPEVDGAGANMFNHNLYINYSEGTAVTLRNNIIARASSHGAQMRMGGIAEDNFFARNAIGLLLGYSQYAMPVDVRAHALNNVITEGQTMFKGKNPCLGNKDMAPKALCTAAIYGLDINIHGLADYQSKNNIVSGRVQGDTRYSPTYTNPHVVAFYVQRIQPEDKTRNIIQQNNIAYGWANATEGAGIEYRQPGLTLADYNASLGGARDFDEFMNKAKSRELQTWDVRYTARSINQFIREGYAIGPPPASSSSSSSSTSSSSSSSSSTSSTSSSSSSSSTGAVLPGQGMNCRTVLLCEGVLNEG